MKSIINFGTSCKIKVNFFSKKNCLYEWFIKFKRKSKIIAGLGMRSFDNQYCFQNHQVCNSNNRQVLIDRPYICIQYNTIQVHKHNSLYTLLILMAFRNR